MNPLINIIINPDGGLPASGSGLDAVRVNSKVGDEAPPPDAVNTQVGQRSQGSEMAPSPEFSSVSFANSVSEMPPEPGSELSTNGSAVSEAPPPDEIAQGLAGQKRDLEAPPGPEEFASLSAFGDGDNTGLPPGPM